MTSVSSGQLSPQDEAIIEEVCDMWRWLLATRDSAATYLETETQTNLVAYHAAREQLNELNSLLLTYAKESRGLSPIRTIYRENRDIALMMADQGIQFLLKRVHRQEPQGVVTRCRTFPAFERLASAGLTRLYLKYVGCDLRHLFDLIHSDRVVETYCTKGPAKASVLLLGQVRNLSARTVERGIRSALEKIAEKEARKSGEQIDSAAVASVLIFASGGVIPGDRSDPLPVMYGPPPDEERRPRSSKPSPPSRAAKAPVASDPGHDLATMTPSGAPRRPRRTDRR